MQAFAVLARTALGRRLGISKNAIQSRVFVTTDFNTTIIPDAGPPRDEYCRPIRWILWSTVTETAVIISDFEANDLLPLLEEQCRPIVYLIAYAAPVNKSMIAFDSLTFFSLPKLPNEWHAPKWLVRDIGIFAGRTYFDYDSQYSAICETLALSK